MSTQVLLRKLSKRKAIAMSKGFGYKYNGTKGHIVGIVSSLPCNPDIIVKNGWEEISHPNAKATGHRLFKEKQSGLKIEFDKKIPGAPGYRGLDHYHILNPNATSAKDKYLDINGNPVKSGSPRSHIMPKGDK